jgi:hypothetical protein
VDLMAVPTGDSPEKVQQYYAYLQGHHETDGRVVTWTVDWVSVAWLWGFVIALTAVSLLWIMQYRTTRQRGSIYPVDIFGGFTSEIGRPATRFFFLLTGLLTGFAIMIILGHLIWGQKF